MRLVVLAAALAASAATALGASVATARAEPVPVVATFSILGDMVREVGGDRVALTTLVGPDGDAHVYQPTPADARAIRDARLVVSNGLGFEGWMDRLVEASGYDGPVLVATDGIEPIPFGEAAHGEAAHGETAHGEAAHEDDHAHDDHAGEEHAHSGEHDHAHEDEHARDDHAHGDEGHAHDDHAHGDAHAHDHGDIDPHAWQSLANARVYVANIADALTEVDPEGAETYAANRDRYLGEIAALEAEFAARLARIPEERRTVVTSHEAFGYLAEATGIRFLAPAGASTESDVSAQDLAALIGQIRAEGISAIFVENVADPRLVERIAAETDAVVGGTLFSDALSEPTGPAATYLDMMRYNIETLTAALGA